MEALPSSKRRFQRLAHLRLVRFVVAALLGALAWELFAYVLDYEFIFSRAIIAALFYAVIWEVLVILLKPKSLPQMVLLGVCSPYIAIVCSVFGSWLLLITLKFWWIFVTAGLVNGAASYIFYRMAEASKKNVE